MITALDARAIDLHDGLTVASRELGSGPPVLLLHGWPTSSLLWRRVMPRLAEQNRVIALDLPGFGASDKPVDVRYDFDLFDRAIDGVLDHLEIGEVGLVGHDIGGPIGLHWAMQQPSRLTRIALLNTILYPELPDAVIEFVATLGSPTRRDELTGPEGLAEIMRLGVADPAVITDDVLSVVLAPFRTDADRVALANAGIGLSVRGIADVAAGLSSLRMPVRAIYGEQDRILPDISETMTRLARDVPQAEITALPDVGHFLQEEDPERVADLLARFFAPT